MTPARLERAFLCPLSRDPRDPVLLQGDQRYNTVCTTSYYSEVTSADGFDSSKAPDKLRGNGSAHPAHNQFPLRPESPERAYLSIPG